MGMWGEMKKKDGRMSVFVSLNIGLLLDMQRLTILLDCIVRFLLKDCVVASSNVEVCLIWIAFLVVYNLYLGYYIVKVFAQKSIETKKLSITLDPRSLYSSAMPSH